jgi:hypothetical protein
MTVTRSSSFFLNSFNKLGFLIKVESFSCEVKTESVYESGLLLVLKICIKRSLNDFKSFQYKFEFKIIHVTIDDFVRKTALGSRTCNEMYA